ncbi:unnamed protein product, partial [Mesorhabditis belari]|uniref:Translocation protein SEC62 n=1 Tax=Mesorhabditis belari TaxID=2138241 RepID=A0AAF3F4N0_9BILA
MAPRRKKNEDDSEDSAAMNKEQEAIAKFVRFNTPTESTLFQGNDVHYFTGSKAVDTLYESKYGTKAKGEPKFADRRVAVKFLEGLFESRLFWRARKLVAKKKEDKDKKKGDESDVNKSPRPETLSKKKDKKEKQEKADEGNESVSEAPEDEKKKEEKDEKKKKKIKLEVHQSQVFTDSSDVYVWVYDPTPLYKKVIGLGMVFGTIACCLFPLWPMWLRQGVYYLSMAGIGAFGAIVVTAILRTILFGVIWLFTGGRHHLWILPNLTEDCGFFESFKPWYTYEYRPNGKAPPKGEKKKKKDKVSDDENETVQDNSKAGVTEKADQESGSLDVVDDEEDTEQNDDSETASSASTGEGAAPEESSPKIAAPKVRRRARKDDDFVVVDN